MHAWLLGLAAAGVVALGSSAAQAQQGGYTVVGGTPNGTSQIAVVPSATNEPGSRTLGTRRINGSRAHRPEEYGGVTPGVSLPTGFRRMARAGNARVPVVAWPGFQMQPGGSRVFVAMTRPAVVTETRTPLQRVFHIAGGRVGLSNNRRPLITEAFDTPAVRAFLRPVRGGVDLVINVRAEVEHRTSQEVGPQGLNFVYVDFPPFQAPDTLRLRLPSGAIQQIEVGAPVTTNAVVPREREPTLNGPGVVINPGGDNERPPAMR
ncbi:MAG: hypothetical protein JWM10_208 [Myxococcaceae bacterium]|nr:hypothetical protein [Myxococcaceae bacterium]